MKNIQNPRSIKKRIRAERVPASFPVRVGRSTGVSKDISASGIFFEIDQQQKIGSNIVFTIDLETPGGPIQVQCEGTIVRVEEANGRVGVGVNIKDSTFKSR